MSLHVLALGGTSSLSGCSRRPAWETSVIGGDAVFDAVGYWAVFLPVVVVVTGAGLSLLMWRRSRPSHRGVS